MLSATGEGPPYALVNSAHEILEKKTPFVWPTADDESLWYPPLAVFLNNCVDACHKALEKHHKSAERSSRFYGRLNFIGVYDRTTHDGVEGASPVKPDLVGGLDLEPGKPVAWSPPDMSIDQVLIPVEVKVNWALMVAQVATYAHCLFSASSSPQFSGSPRIPAHQGSTPFLGVPPQWPDRVETLLCRGSTKRISCSFSFLCSGGHPSVTPVSSSSSTIST